MQEMLVEFWDSGCVKHYKGNVAKKKKKKRPKLEADFGKYNGAQEEHGGRGSKNEEWERHKLTQSSQVYLSSTLNLAFGNSLQNLFTFSLFKHEES